MIDYSTREKSIYTAQTVNDIGRSSITFSDRLTLEIKEITIQSKFKSPT